MVYRNMLVLTLTLVLISTTSWAGDFDARIPMTRADSGSYHVEGSFAGSVAASFLVDTGAGMSVIEHGLLKRLREVSEVALSRRIAARLANGEIQAVNVYRVEGFTIGAGCEIGSVEVAVMRGSGNILGLNALEKLAPFALHLTSPSLAVSHCGPANLLSLN